MTGMLEVRLKTQTRVPQRRFRQISPLLKTIPSRLALKRGQACWADPVIQTSMSDSPPDP
jgi:hypothetical protein